MSEADQAAGLRRWAETQPEPSTGTADSRPASRVLMVLGLPDGAQADVKPVSRALERWHAQGQRWVGDPVAWRVVALDTHSPHLAVLTTQQPRWALWVGDDLDGFRRAYLTLRRVSQQGGPSRLLLVHPPLPSRAGLLDNLQQAAAQFLGVDLLVIGMPRRRVESL
ncbi:hypothetical protein SAMN05661010_00565 [Modicisalibacter muralis]|uniref:DUF2868 domain-containing protein n=1 Tax=Modicisalibacter muralis TaxID=119000 RepID=A0A1G9G0I8_9GAMM|nr:hypothetical protein [Halomonas muralis]SDK94146.1 hypothetical protein SAMN05661010_00565 [Halomonas muralis]